MDEEEIKKAIGAMDGYCKRATHMRMESIDGDPFRGVMTLYDEYGRIAYVIMNAQIARYIIQDIAYSFGMRFEWTNREEFERAWQDIGTRWDSLMKNGLKDDEISRFCEMYKGTLKALRSPGTNEEVME